MTTMPPVTSARGIESIAHHFLSQAAPSQPPVQRVSPRQQSCSEPVQEAVQSNNSDEIENQPVSKPVIDTCVNIEDAAAGNDDCIMPVRIALISTGSPGDEALADQYAQQIAYHNGRVGLLSIQNNSIKMVQYDSSEPIEKEDKSVQQNTFLKKDLSLDDEELRALLESISPENNDSDDPARHSAGNSMEKSFRCLTSDTEALLIQMDPRLSRCYESMIKSSDVAMLMTHADSDSLVATYQNIKWLANDLQFHGNISLYIADSDTARVDAVYEKLAKTTRRFLQIELGEPEFPLPCEHIYKKVLYEQAVDQRQLDYLQCLLSCKETAKVVGDTLSEQEKGDRTIKISTSLSRKKTVVCPLAVSQFPADDKELTETLASSAPAWLTEVEGPVIVSIPIPKSVDSSVKLLADYQGRCHIMLADYQPDQLLVRACAFRKWLTDHLPLIRQACPNIKMDENLEPGIILVSPGNIEPLKQAAAQFENLPIRIKQLLLLDDGHSQSLLVI